MTVILSLPCRPLPYFAAKAEADAALSEWYGWRDMIRYCLRTGLNLHLLSYLQNREELAWERWCTARKLRHKAIAGQL